MGLLLSSPLDPWDISPGEGIGTPVSEDQNLGFAGGCGGRLPGGDVERVLTSAEGNSCGPRRKDGTIQRVSRPMGLREVQSRTACAKGKEGWEPRSEKRKPRRESETRGLGAGRSHVRGCGTSAGGLARRVDRLQRLSFLRQPPPDRTGRPGS